MNAVLSDKTVGVIGSGDERHESLAGSVGELLARLEVNLLTGGGSGVMAAVNRAFVAARRGRGICIGIIPCSEADMSTPKDGYPNEFVELPMYTHLPYSGVRGQESLSRNHINVLSSAAIVALPGGAGTASEVSLALRYRKPIVVFSPDEVLVGHFSTEAPRATTVDDVARFLEQHLGCSVCSLEETEGTERDSTRRHGGTDNSK
jgi:uncharacterized protein (TIGR00725 family)